MERFLKAMGIALYLVVSHMHMGYIIYTRIKPMSMAIGGHYESQENRRFDT